MRDRKDNVEAWEDKSQIVDVCIEFTLAWVLDGDPCSVTPAHDEPDMFRLCAELIQKGSHLSVGVCRGQQSVGRG